MLSPPEKKTGNRCPPSNQSLALLAVFIYRTLRNRWLLIVRLARAPNTLLILVLSGQLKGSRSVVEEVV